MARRKNKGRVTLASKADRHRLYEKSVQNPVEEVRTIEAMYTALRGVKPRVLREDFCGTAKAACEWVRTNRRHRAIAVDIDADVLDWGRTHNAGRLKEGARKRLTLVNDDVLSVRADPADIIVAFNFSYWVFARREQMRRYFESVREGLAPDGVFILDVYGGSEAFTETREKTDHGRFTYVWEQAEYEPISGKCVCYIHFHFPDGSKLKQAFRYEWRLWTMPELRELLEEAGFSRSTVHWEQTGKDGEGNGEYAPAERGEADPAWIAYVVAEP